MEKIPDQHKRGSLLAGVGLIMLGIDRVTAAPDPTEQAIEQPPSADDMAFIERAFAMRRAAVDSGDQAYGAVVVRDGRIVGQSPSRVLLRRDPTAHAEMEAIRDAARRLGSGDLRGCTLYSSTAACPMCEAAAYWAGIERQVSGRKALDGGRPRLCG
jgi:tRNA(Arg) A34 adenosine deaminase TadA